MSIGTFLVIVIVVGILVPVIAEDFFDALSDYLDKRRIAKAEKRAEKRRAKAERQADRRRAKRAKFWSNPERLRRKAEKRWLRNQKRRGA